MVATRTTEQKAPVRVRYYGSSSYLKN